MTCTIDPPLVDKLAQATKALEASIHEKGWQLADDSYRDHLATAQRAAAETRLQEAFAEQCRAMKVLMDAVHQQRSREESFRPLWDRDPLANGQPPRG